MDLNAHVQEAMAEVVQRLKRNFPTMEFFFVLMPFERFEMAHLSTEQRKELEKRVTAAASREFRSYLNAR